MCHLLWVLFKFTVNGSHYGTFCTKNWRFNGLTVYYITLARRVGQTFRDLLMKSFYLLHIHMYMISFWRSLNWSEKVILKYATGRSVSNGLLLFRLPCVSMYILHSHFKYVSPIDRWWSGNHLFITKAAIQGFNLLPLLCILYIVDSIPPRFILWAVFGKLQRVQRPERFVNASVSEN